MATSLGVRKRNKRKWTYLGGDLEGSYDGVKYIDVRVSREPGSTRKKSGIFMSKEVIQKLLELFPENHA